MTEATLVERLRAYAARYLTDGEDRALLLEAANHIEGLYAERRTYYASGMLDAARVVGTRAHLSEAQDQDQTVAEVLRYCEAAIQSRAATIEVP